MCGPGGKCRGRPVQSCGQSGEISGGREPLGDKRPAAGVASPVVVSIGRASRARTTLPGTRALAPSEKQQPGISHNIYVCVVLHQSSSAPQLRACQSPSEGAKSPHQTATAAYPAIRWSVRPRFVCRPSQHKGKRGPLMYSTKPGAGARIVLQGKLLRTVILGRNKRCMAYIHRYSLLSSWKIEFAV